MSDKLNNKKQFVLLMMILIVLPFAKSKKVKMKYKSFKKFFVFGKYKSGY